MMMKDKIIIKEKIISDILPPFKPVEVYAIMGQKTKINIGYYAKKDYSLAQVEDILKTLEN
jgi:hypothetical protein